MDETPSSRYRGAETRLWSDFGAEPRERWVDVAGHGIRVRVLEVGEGPPILFVHGITAAASMWATLVARLPRHRCLVLDRPGCGLSPPLPDDRVGSLTALVDVEVAILDSLGVESADVVGNSFGGACVLALALAKPQRVRRIVLEGAPAIAGIRPPLYIRLLAAGPIGRYLVRRRSSTRDVRWSFDQFGERKLAASGLSSSTLDWAMSLANDTDTRRNEVLVVQAIASWRRFYAAWLFDPARLSGIDQPTLWLWGANDPLATAQHARAWAVTMPHATFEVLDAGHVPWLDDAGFHARRIEAFLDDGQRHLPLELPVAAVRRRGAGGRPAAEHRPVGR